jgi:hypothetical protein
MADKDKLLRGLPADDPDGTRLEQARRKERLTSQLRSNLKRRKAGYATAKDTDPEADKP